MPLDHFPVNGINGRVLSHDGGLIVNDATAYPDFIEVFEGDTPWKAFLGVPLLRKGKSVGMIAVGDREGGYRIEELQVLEAIAPAVIEALDRKRAEEALRQSEERFRMLANNMSQFAWMADEQGWIFWYNQRSFDYTGTTSRRNERLGLAETPPRRIMSNASCQRIRRCFQTGEVWEDTFPLRGKDGIYRWFLSRAIPIRDEHGNVINDGSVHTHRCDQTSYKHRRIWLLPKSASAQGCRRAGQSAKDHFLAVLSHELRTPLTPVVMGVSMLQDRPDLDPKVRETLEMVRSNVEMEARLIDDLLDVTRIARGKIELNQEPVELCTVIQRAVEVCKPDIEARRLHFGVDLGPAAPYWVEADVSRLQQVFWNLLKNAIKFTPHGGCVGIRCRPNEKHVLVEVNDSGIGIEPEALSRIFNAFEQAERSITRQFGGLGFGFGDQ